MQNGLLGVTLASHKLDCLYSQKKYWFSCVSEGCGCAEPNRLAGTSSVSTPDQHCPSSPQLAVRGEHSSHNFLPLLSHPLPILFITPFQVLSKARSRQPLVQVAQSADNGDKGIKLDGPAHRMEIITLKSFPVP